MLLLNIFSIFEYFFDIFDFLIDILFVNLDGFILLSAMPVVTKEGSKLYNEYVVGLSDTEATFTIFVAKDNRVRKTSRRSSDTSITIYSVHPSFAISLKIYT